MMNSKYKSTVGSLQSTIFCLTFLICNLQFVICNSQEVVTPLTCNPILVHKYNELVNEKKFHLHSAASDTLSLPFLDDFSKEGVYPDSALWLDKGAFINRTYPIAPPTLGVATLDGVGPSGKPYDITASASSSLPADTLTSKPIRLSGILPSDSLYFSFFWQAQGRGNTPDKYDSLLVQFKNPSLNDTIAWSNVWSHPGFTSYVTDTVFHLVMLKVDPAFFKDGFQFRFRNWATISGNVDHWHIDYVFLDKRNLGRYDTIFNDVAFAYNSSSLLSNYTAMPWEQYQPSEMKSNLNFFIRNNGAVQTNTGFLDTIFNSSGGIECSYNAGFDNIVPYPPYCNLPLFANPPVSDSPLYSFPLLTQDTSFLLKCVLKTTTDKDNWNDTLRYRQKFYDYYSYDDGTVEGGYGLNVLGGEIAYKFTLNHTDTLVAVQMLFNWMATNVTAQGFRISLWNDAGGIPGTMFYQDSLVFPQYNYIAHPSGWGNLTNDFHTYMLTSPETLSGTFYVGWQQFTPETLNVGLDKNINSNNKMFYNIGSGWTQSVIPGSWMIRPVFRNTAGIASVANNDDLLHPFKVFPNPTSGQFTVYSPQFTVGSNLNVEIYNVFGEIVFRQTLGSKQETVNLNAPSGIYFLRMTDEKGFTHSQKLILSK